MNPDPKSQQHSSHALLRALRFLLRWSLIAWAFLLILYFEQREGLIPQWIFEPSSRAGAFQAVLKALFGMGGGFDPSWESAPWRHLGFAAVAAVLSTLLGALILSWFSIYPTPVARLGLSFAVGVGAAGVAFELLALAGLLSRPWVIATWFLLLAGSAFVTFYLQHRGRLGPHPAGGWIPESERRRQAARWHETVVSRPRSLLSRLHFAAAALLIALISVLVTLHAVGQPETYWDSLILYIGYARKIFLEHSFPVKVVGQVGIGLGANYPHLFEVLAAQTAALAGSWHDVVAQLLPPLAGIASTLLVYALALDITRDRPTAISLALLFRAVPHSLIYFQYASSYSTAILLTAAFLYLAWKYTADGLPGYRDLMLLTAAFAVHVNYLMFLLWGAAAVVILAAHVRQKRMTVLPDVWTGPEIPDLPPGAMEIVPPSHVALRLRPTLPQLLRTRRFWVGLAAALAVASPWYIRNTLVTGNPVYAFYANLFPATRRVNPEVMRSAEQEWLRNGDGLGRVGRTLSEKLLNSWGFFVTGEQHWKLAPVFMAFVIPGFVVFLGWSLWWIVRRLPRREILTDPADNALFRFGLGAAVLFLLLWTYAYVIAGFYLYQIIVVLPLFAVFAAFVWRMCDTRPTRATLHVLALVVGFSPGLIMALMGFKLQKTGIYVGMPSPQFALTALKKLFMDPKVYYRMEFNGDMEMFDRLRALPGDARLLSHENRHLLMEERLPIVHLDDWEVQQTYRKPAAERLRILDGLGITHYLYVPNEDNHVINSLVGMDELIRLGHFREIYRTQSSRQSSPELVEHNVIPQNMNVLYERVR